MTEMTPGAIQILLDRPEGEGMIVSCYANTSVTAGFVSLWSEHLKEEASAIEERLADDPQARTRFANDLAIIQHALEEPAARRARGMAVFSAADQGVFLTFTLAVPVKDRLVLAEQRYLVPLLEAMHRQRRYLVVLTDSQHGRLYEASWGHTHLLQQIDEPAPRRQRSAGERWGKQQATIARHREDHLLHYRKNLVRTIEKTWPDAPFRGLILLGEHETLQALRAALPSALADRVVHMGPRSWDSEQPGIEAKVQEVLDETVREHDAQLIADFERRMQEHYLVAAGPQEVVNALRSGQVGYPGFLILEPDRGAMAMRCTRCESLFTTMPATCPYCQGTCEPVNLWQEILLFAARHHITAHTVNSHPALSRHGGVAAVLSRQEPWDSASEIAAKRGGASS